MENVKEQVKNLRLYLDKIVKLSRKEMDASELKTYAAYHSGRLDLAIDLLELTQKLSRITQK